MCLTALLCHDHLGMLSMWFLKFMLGGTECKFGKVRPSRLPILVGVVSEKNK